MRFPATIFAALLLALVACNQESYSRSNSGFSSLDKKLLYDFRNPQPATYPQPPGNLKLPPGTTFIGSYDLNGDKKQKYLLQALTIGTAGRQIKTARLVEFDKQNLVTAEDFGEVYDDACTPTGGSLSARVIYFLPPPAGQKARFIVELYDAPCPAKGQPPQWTRVGAK